MKPFLIIFLSMLALDSAYASRGSEGGNGGEVFEIGERVILFDALEYGENFDPKNVNDAKPWEIIDNRLNKLKDKMPATADYLRSFFSHGKMVWWFITEEQIKLAPTGTAGDTNVIITYKQEQIAVNSKGMVQIRKQLWDKLTDRQKAWLLTHEMFWSALGDPYIGNGQSIRALTALLMGKQIEDFTTYNLARFMNRYIGDDGRRSKLSRKVGQDLSAGFGRGDFSVEEVETQYGVMNLVSFFNQSMGSGLYLSTVNPTRGYETPYFDDYTGDVYLKDDASSFKLNIDVSELCENLEVYGDMNWHLPSEDEIYALYKRGLLMVKYEDDPLFSSTNYITQDLQIVALRSNFSNVTRGFTREVSYFCIADQETN